MMMVQAAGDEMESATALEHEDEVEIMSDSNKYLGNEHNKNRQHNHQ